ncbi:MAG: hypothetical protein CMP23_00910 [Rickettsiales bacterium]|nr:hypothetical protein [Rickettsiales bacterium]|tara:strand:- start:4220 stop:5785 length:1566 start_codon:yes stop_codon:yes gene_type:complete
MAAQAHGQLASKGSLLGLLRCSLICLAVGLMGCDWELFHLYNGLPVPANDEAPDTVHVYLAVDGLDYETMLWAQDEGAFPATSWSLSSSIPMFPATSFTSWTRYLQTEPLSGFEYEYYDPTQDLVINHGDLGLASHIVPPLEGLGLEGSAYFRAFDHHANGYMDVVSNYASPFQNFGRGLDDLFYVLDSRTQDSATFFGYVPQTDIIAHSFDPSEVLSAVLEIDRRIDEFRARHPEREFIFTVFSDHGMNFTPTPPERLVEVDQEMEELGIRVVDSLEPWRDADELVAIPILHSRVTYAALHSFPEDACEIAAVMSGAEGIDLGICRGGAPPAAIAMDLEDSWFRLWRGQQQIAEFGFDPVTDRYLLPRSIDWSRLGLILPPGGGKHAEFESFSDEELFGFSYDASYPDLFYRVRTSFDPISVKWPAEVLLSFRLGWVSAGFSLGCATDHIGASASHGALLEAGSRGVLITEEQELPPAFRGDNILDHFPRLQEHISERRGLLIYPGDPNRGLDYLEIPWQ